jgi:phosphohistidine phosphatase
MGCWLRAAGLIPDRVVCSPAIRARQTWQLAQAALGAAPETVFDETVYEASAAGLLDLIHGAPAGTRALLIVGHDPALPGLARTLAAAAPRDGALLAGNADQSAASRMEAKFPTAAIAAFACAGDWEQLAPGQAQPAFFVIPRELQAATGAPRGRPAG